jgi:hypothetical protein
MVLLTHAASEQTVTDYIDGASFVALLVGAGILVLTVPKVSDRSLKTTTALFAAGFAFQFIFNVIWIYYWHFAEEPGMPDVSIGDFFYLGSYALWTAATIPYLRRYGDLMGRRSRAILAVYAVIAAVIIYESTDYWYNAAISYGYDWFATAVWLSYAVVAPFCLFFMIAVTLLYGYEGYGKGLLRYYWFYFMVPVMMIVFADILNGFYYVMPGGEVPGQLDDMLYLGGYCVIVASGLVVYKSQLTGPPATPSIESRIVKAEPVRIVQGRGYIVEDVQAVQSYDMFLRLVSAKDGDHQRKGYIITRENPTYVRERHGVMGVSITWIATTAGSDVIDPSKPSLIAQAVIDFFSSNRNGVVLLDGLESIMVHNDFSRAVRMLEQMNDFVMQYRGYLIVPINPEAFDEKERAVLERNFEVIRPEA